MKKGFTLIELLVVIAVLGVLAAGVIIAINPAKRMNQANDAKSKSDIGQIATALMSYFTLKQAYPVDQATMQTALIANGDLKNFPTAPTGASYVYDVNVGLTEVSMCATLLAANGVVEEAAGDPADDGETDWCWKSSTGTASEIFGGDCSTCTP